MATDTYGIMETSEDDMTESVKSVNVLVKLYLKGHDLSRDSIEQALNEMNYEFSYNDDYVRIVGTEIIDTFVPDPS